MADTLLKKLHAMHVHFSFLFISQPRSCHIKDIELLLLQFCRQLEHVTKKYQFSTKHSIGVRFVTQRTRNNLEIIAETGSYIYR